MKDLECETCIKRKTMFCPNSSECIDLEDKPFYQNRIMLLEENQELKKQYHIVEKKLCDEYNDMLDKRNKLFVENCKLKKQLEDSEKAVNTFFNGVTTLKTQQKEFIKYLEDEIERLETTEFYIDSIQKAAIATHKHNLEKFKEIVGDL